MDIFIRQIYPAVVLLSRLLSIKAEIMSVSHENMTHILNTLLDGYDNRVMPGHIDNEPTVIKADFNIRSMGPISEEDMAPEGQSVKVGDVICEYFHWDYTYSFDAYFRQTWKDKRLQFNGSFDEMAVHIKLLEKIWKPDTFFYNARGSHIHTITTPNKLLRIRQDGTILYSMRVTVKASCPMFLHYFPVDIQSCPLQFGSYAYTSDVVRYIWKNGHDNSIAMATDMRLSQFDLVGFPAGNATVTKSSAGEFSTLTVNFILSRHMGYFLIQLYVPCTLIVSLSWVSFWINREATADRVGLGVTTVLTLATLSMDSRSDLPKVPYPTALDWFIILCFGFVIASLIEFAGVHYFTKIGYGEVFDYSYQYSRHGDSHHNQQQQPYHQENGGTVSGVEDDQFNPTYWERDSHVTSDPVKASLEYYRTKLSTYKRHGSEGCFRKLVKCLQSDARYKKMMTYSGNESGVNSVSLIDRVSRYLFPASFITINLCYWIAYSWNIVDVKTRQTVSPGKS